MKPFKGLELLGISDSEERYTPNADERSGLASIKLVIQLAVNKIKLMRIFWALKAFFKIIAERDVQYSIIIISYML